MKTVFETHLLANTMLWHVFNLTFNWLPYPAPSHATSNASRLQLKLLNTICFFFLHGPHLLLGNRTCALKIPRVRLAASRFPFRHTPFTQPTSHPSAFTRQTSLSSSDLLHLLSMDIPGDRLSLNHGQPEKGRRKKKRTKTLWAAEPLMQSLFASPPKFFKVCDSHVNKVMHILSCMSPQLL